jgi:hypothetical protein
LINQADIKSAGGVAPRVRTQEAMTFLIKNLAVTAALLAGYGADVLIDPPGWDGSPNRTNVPMQWPAAAQGIAMIF